MEWIERFNEAISYIEEHLTEEIDYEQLGRIACCSSYHFQRMFTYMAGVPLSEYIRRRKMSLAAVDLQGGNMKIIDVAGKYGYSSPTAFNRAFQTVHGIAPSAVKSEGVSVKSFPPILFKITVKGVEEMNYRIETKDAFRIVGVSVPLDKDIEKNFSVIPQKWQEISTNGTLQRLTGMMDTPPLWECLASAPAMTRSPGDIILRYAPHRKRGIWKNMLFRQLPGRSFPAKAPISRSRNWSVAS